jgi:hypothetical protein
MIIGTWNVRTLFERGKLGQVEYQMERYTMDILGVNKMEEFYCTLEVIKMRIIELE